MGITERIAQIIRQADGNHSLGAAELAEAIVSELRLTEKRQYSSVNSKLIGGYYYTRELDTD